MTGAAAPVPPKRRLSRGVIAAYGAGAVAYGVKDTGFGNFLLLFYNQVIGLPAATVGAVIMAALLLDALVDPAVGFFSDRTRGRWGRRHPWMYGSALPIMIGYVLLWHPPVDASTGIVLLWLFGCAVIVRTAVSCYEVPSVALTPELTSDYDERTRIMAWRYLWGWGGGLALGLTAWLWFLRPTPEYANGLLNRDGYSGFAILGAMTMGGAILVSALGTHREIPRLPQPVLAVRSLGDSFREMGRTVRNRGFAVLMLASLFVYTNQGIAYAMGNYLFGYVWGFSTGAFVALTLAFFVSAVTAFVVAPRLGRRGNKPILAARVFAIGSVIASAPYWLKLLGLAPAPTTPIAVPFVITLIIVGTAFNITGYILAASTMADVVEDAEAKTGQRAEGIFFAGSFFVQKCTSGVGIFAASLILAAAGFPDKAVPGQVPEAALDRLLLIYSATYLTLAFTAAVIFRRFPFGRAEHEARVARLGALDVAEGSAGRA
ncbi:MAG TPA: MFS transporter [Sphingomonas sp.]